VTQLLSAFGKALLRSEIAGRVMPESW
jgi:hypothetical protein